VPTELISFEGEPTGSDHGTNLLFANNTASDVFKASTLRDLRSRRGTAGIRGSRWTAPGRTSPPTGSEGLREDSAESDKSDSRASVAGTDEAEDALLDAQIPQTTAIDRKSAKLQVTYDGKRSSVDIPNSGVEYAINTPTSVLRCRGKYYACDQAVWYVRRARRPVGSQRCAARRSRQHPSVEPRLQHEVRLRLRLDAERRLRRLYPRLHGQLSVGPDRRLGNGVHLPSVGTAPTTTRAPSPTASGFGTTPERLVYGFGWSNGFFSFGMRLEHGRGWYGPGVSIRRLRRLRRLLRRWPLRRLVRPRRYRPPTTAAHIRATVRPDTASPAGTPGRRPTLRTTSTAGRRTERATPPRRISLSTAPAARLRWRVTADRSPRHPPGRRHCLRNQGRPLHDARRGPADDQAERRLRGPERQRLPEERRSVAEE